MDRPKYVVKITTRHGKTAYYYSEDKRHRIRLPDEYGTKEFWAAVEEAKTVPALPRVARPTTVALRKAKYRREMTSKVGRVMVAAVRAARTRSRKRDWKFDLTTDWALDTVRAQEFRCALTGIPFFTEHSARSKVHPFTPSIDRIDCRRGYTQDNVRIVVWAINAMLLDWGEDLFAQVANRFKAHRSRETKSQSSRLAPSKPGVLRAQ